VKPSKSGGYNLVGEAFSDNENNFWPREIETCFERIGIEKIWQKLSREVDFQSVLGARDAEGTEQRARRKLEDLLRRRNHMVHRGKSYYTPSESEVRDCIIFLKSLIRNLAEVMEKQISAI
jgi:RiboL-PSP-HEPN